MKGNLGVAGLQPREASFDGDKLTPRQKPRSTPGNKAGTWATASQPPELADLVISRLCDFAIFKSRNHQIAKLQKRRAALVSTPYPEAAIYNENQRLVDRTVAPARGPQSDADFAADGVTCRGGKSELRRAVCRITSGVPVSRPEYGQCHRKHTVRLRRIRVKRCGKSAPPEQQCSGQGKPHTEQDQIGRESASGGHALARRVRTFG